MVTLGENMSKRPSGIFEGGSIESVVVPISVPPEIGITIDLIQRIPDLSDESKRSLLVYFAWHMGTASALSYLHSIGLTEQEKIHEIIFGLMDEPYLVEDFESIEKAVTVSREIRGRNPHYQAGQRYLAFAVWDMLSSDEDLTDLASEERDEKVMNRGLEILRQDLQTEINKPVSDLTDQEISDYAIRFYKRGATLEFLADFFEVSKSRIKRLMPERSKARNMRYNTGHSENTREKRHETRERLKQAIERYLIENGTVGFSLKGIAEAVGINKNTALVHYKRFLAEGLPFPQLRHGGHRRIIQK